MVQGLGFGVQLCGHLELRLLAAEIFVVGVLSDFSACHYLWGLQLQSTPMAC